MYELNRITENCYYIESPAKIGLVRVGEADGRSEVVLIDSGNDKDAGRRVRKILDENGWSLKAIYNTHSNADHIGGNKYLQEQTGCRVYAPGIECDFTRHPLLEPSFLYGGFPPKELRHKFLMAQPSDAEELVWNDGGLAANVPEGWEVIPLPGHFFEMVGFRTADDVVYLADCLSGRETLDKYAVGYIYDVGAYLRTLETVKEMRARAFVPAHAEMTDDIAPLAQYNIDKVNEVADRIAELCGTPVTWEELLKQLFDSYGLTLSFEQYALVGNTLRSYLSWLKDTGRVDAEFAANRMLWRRL